MTLDIGNTIRIIRQAKGAKLGDVAKDAAISAPFLTLIEKGKRGPSMDVLRRLAKALDIPVEALVVASQSPSSKIMTSNKRAIGLLESIERLAGAEERLRKQLGKDARDAKNAATRIASRTSGKSVGDAGSRTL